MTSPFDGLAACHPVLSEAATAANEYWDPGPVPLSVGLGALGNALVKAERDIPDEALARVAACVEEALGSRGDVRDAMATGFLEAIAHRADQAPASVERIVRSLGPRAVEYVRAWDDFSGSSTPGAR
jgi:hypothetical protein